MYVCCNKTFTENSTFTGSVRVCVCVGCGTSEEFEDSHIEEEEKQSGRSTFPALVLLLFS